jgi:transcriptional regulator GlxA family with amidase domain
MSPSPSAFAILAYDGVEAIDIGATYGVFSIAKRLVPSLEFFVVSKMGGELSMANGLRLIADYSLADCPAANVLIVLGGPGWEAACSDAKILAFIREFHRRNGIIASVCTGAMILAAAGLLDGCAATTKREIVGGEKCPLSLLAERHPGVRVVEARIVDNGDVLTSGGIALGIDMTLHLIRRFVGEAVAEETARVLEYRHAWKTNGMALCDLIQSREHVAS